MDDTTNITLSPADAKRQRMRSIAIGLALGFMVIMFYAATIIQFGAQVARGPA